MRSFANYVPQSLHGEKGFLAVLLLLFTALSVQYTGKIVDLRDGKQDRSAILRWRDQLQQLDSGENIYERFTYPNPPIMALILRPIAELPPIAGALTWYFLKVGMALFCIVTVFRLVTNEDDPFPFWAKILAAALSLRPILGDLSHGNVNLFILTLVVACLASYRRGWDRAAGIWLGLAIACKVTPALFLVYFLWKRSWNVLAGTVLGLVLFLVVVPAIFLGWNHNLNLLESWIRQMVTPFLIGGVVTSEHQNQSLPGLVHRMLTQSPSFVDFIQGAYTPTAFHNVAELSTRTAGLLIKAFLLGYLALMAWTCRTPTQPRARTLLAAEYALIVLGMLLFSERTWKHHCVVLLIPYAVLAQQLAKNSLPSWKRGVVLGSLVASQLLIASTSTSLMDETAKLAQVYGAYCLAFLALIAALATVLHGTAPSGTHQPADHSTDSPSAPGDLAAA